MNANATCVSAGPITQVLLASVPWMLLPVKLLISKSAMAEESVSVEYATAQTPNSRDLPVRCALPALGPAQSTSKFLFFVLSLRGLLLKQVLGKRLQGILRC